MNTTTTARRFGYSLLLGTAVMVSSLAMIPSALASDTGHNAPAATRAEPVSPKSCGWPYKYAENGDPHDGLKESGFNNLSCVAPVHFWVDVPGPYPDSPCMRALAGERVGWLHPEYITGVEVRWC